MSDNERLREVATRFIEAVERAEKSKQPATGMQVPYHGEFCSANPAVMRDLKWFAWLFREAVGRE